MSSYNKKVTLLIVSLWICSVVLIVLGGYGPSFADSHNIQIGMKEFKYPYTKVTEYCLYTLLASVVLYLILWPRNKVVASWRIVLCIFLFFMPAFTRVFDGPGYLEAFMFWFFLVIISLAFWLVLRATIYAVKYVKSSKTID